MNKIILTVLVFLLSGCASTPLKDYATTMTASPKNLDMSRIIMYRPTSKDARSGSHKLSLDILIDGIKIEPLGYGHFVFKDLPKGKHTITISDANYNDCKQEFTSHGDKTFLEINPTEKSSSNHKKCSLATMFTGGLGGLACLAAVNDKDGCVSGFNSKEIDEQEAIKQLNSRRLFY